MSPKQVNRAAWSTLWLIFSLLLSSSAIAALGNARRQKQDAAAMCCYGMFLSSRAIAARGNARRQKQDAAAMCCYGMFLNSLLLVACASMAADGAERLRPP